MIYILVSYEGLSMMRLIGKQAKTTEQERNVVIERRVKVGAPRRKFEGESICSWKVIGKRLEKLFVKVNEDTEGVKET